VRRQAHPVFCEAAGASLALFRRNGREETIHTSLTRRDVPYRFDEYAYAAVVANGIGEGAGAVAARLAVSTLAQLELRFGQWSMRIHPQVAADIMDRARWFYDRAHEAVRRWQRAHQEMGRIAAALTAVFSAGNDLFVAHVGTNGLADMVSDAHIADALASRRTPQEQCDLVGAALANGGTDNVTVVLANDHIPSPRADSK